MTDEVALRQDVDRGNQAASLLAHPLMAEAFEALDKRCWEAFKATPHKDAESREYVHALMIVQRDFKHYFETLVTEGQSAAAQLRNEERQQKLRSAPR